MRSRVYLPISMVFHFFEKVQVFVQHKQINETLARKLLGYYVWQWHHDHYPQLSTGVTDPEFRGWLTGFDALKNRIGRQGQGM